MSDTTDEILREIGDLAAANSVWKSQHSEESESKRREAEERAHSAGVSWKRIDRARMVGLLDQNWLDIRNSPHLEESIRSSLLSRAESYAWQLRYMVAVEVLRSRQRRADTSIAQSVHDAGQQRRNMAGLAADVETIAALIDMTEAERAAVRANAMDDWPRMMAGTAEVMDTSDAIEEVWWDDLGDPWFQRRSDRIAATLRHPIPEPSSPVLTTPEELVASAKQVLEAEPPHTQLDGAVHLREAGDVSRSALIEPDTARTQVGYADHTQLHPDQGLPGSTPAITPTSSVVDAITAALPAPDAANPHTGLGQRDSEPPQPPAAAADTGPQL